MMIKWLRIQKLVENVAGKFVADLFLRDISVLRIQSKFYEDPPEHFFWRIRFDGLRVTMGDAHLETHIQECRSININALINILYELHRGCDGM